MSARVGKPQVTLGVGPRLDAGRVEEARRRLLADWCRLVGRRLGGYTGTAPVHPPAGLPETPEPPPQPVPPSQPAAARPAVADAVAALDLPPRLAQTLTALLAGAGEKQIARDLSISPHTVHTYVKQLHKRLNVSSRGELLARFVALDR